MWLAKGIAARLYFSVSKSHSPKYITEVVLGFEEVLSWIRLLILFYFLHVFISVNPVPTIYFLILYLKRICTYRKYCMALFAFSAFLSLPSVFFLTLPLLISPAVSPFSIIPTSPFSVSYQPPFPTLPSPLFLFLLLFYLLLLEYDCKLLCSRLPLKILSWRIIWSGRKLKQVNLEAGGWTGLLLEDECWRLGKSYQLTVGLN